MRVAIYARISTDEEHQPYSLEAQDVRLAAYVQSQDGWEATRRYSDRMTGSTLKRPELQRALVDARRLGHLDAVPGAQDGLLDRELPSEGAEGLEDALLAVGEGHDLALDWFVIAQPTTTLPAPWLPTPTHLLSPLARRSAQTPSKPTAAIALRSH
jgi:hypothetical protein